MENNILFISAWAAVVSALAAFGGLVALCFQIARSRFAVGVDLLLKMDDRFNGKEMDEKRKVAAKSLLNEPNEDVDNVLDFFETIGLLVRRRALDKEMVWHTFFYWIYGYWNAAEKYIEEKREKDPEVWRDFEELYDLVLKMENNKRRKRGYKPLKYSGDSRRKFLEEESDLSD